LCFWEVYESQSHLSESIDWSGIGNYVFAIGGLCSLVFSLRLIDCSPEQLEDNFCTMIHVILFFILFSFCTVEPPCGFQRTGLRCGSVLDFRVSPGSGFYLSPEVLQKILNIGPFCSGDELSEIMEYKVTVYCKDRSCSDCFEFCGSFLF